MIPSLKLACNTIGGFAVRISAFGFLVACRSWAIGADVDFFRDVLPVFQRSCVECHGATKQEGQLRLDRADAVDRGVIVESDAAASELVRRISLPKEDDEVMPNRGNTLSKLEIQRIIQWIDSGAHWPSGTPSVKHWSYEVPVKPLPPDIPDGVSAPLMPIDAFVVKRLRQEGIQNFAPEASRETLIRRLSLDLVGLPPSIEEVTTFVLDTSEHAYERLVDRLLTSEQFGVRWARPWLDYARYADSHGFQRDDFRDLWPYRDWVVDALNADMPFTQFTIEQIAGDLLPEATLSQKIATGFNRSSPTNVEAGSDPEETRVNQVHDRINALGMIWLGATLECAQCHDHKYDPITQRDYYGLFAFFNNTSLEADRTNPSVPGSIQFSGPVLELADPETDGERRQLQSRLQEIKAKILATEQAAVSNQSQWESQLLATVDRPSNAEEPEESAGQSSVKTIPVQVRTALQLAPAKRSAKQTKLILEHYLNDQPEYSQLAKQRSDIETELRRVNPPTTLVMREDTPRMSTIFARGDFRNSTEPVLPHTPAALHPLQAGSSRPNRLDLARWLVSRDNPLVARVVVNRWWSELFGRGLVSTPEDFGIKGERPSHPELLDWLACEFMDSGWSMKSLIKTIVMSKTYRQSSRVTTEMMQLDDRNQLLGRGPRFRLEAEMIRDNALAISGLLCDRQGGPPIRPFQPDGVWNKVGGQKYDYLTSPGTEKYRRGLYVVWKRGAPYPSFVNFDANSRMSCRVERPRSNTPLQALTLLNDPVYVEAAEAFARRVLVDCKHASDSRQLAYAFQLATSRLPKQDELSVLERLLALQREAKANNLPSPTPSTLAEVSNNEFSAWYAVAATLLNLDETISKN